MLYDSSVGKLKKLHPRQWHQQIKKLTGCGNKINFSLPGSSAIDIANDINQRFISVANDISQLHLNHLPAYLPSETPRMSVSPWDVFKKLKSLDITKSGGPDCIPPRVIKEFAYELFSSL